MQGPLPIQPTCFGAYTQPVTVFCIPKDVWLAHIFGKHSFRELQLVALISKAFARVAQLAMPAACRRFFEGFNLLLPNGEDCVRARKYALHNLFSRCYLPSKIMIEFGLTRAEWAHISSNCSKFGQTWSFFQLYIEVLRFRGSFDAFYKQKRARDAKREKAADARKAKREKRERETQEKKQRVGKKIALLK